MQFQRAFCQNYFRFY